MNELELLPLAFEPAAEPAFEPAAGAEVGVAQAGDHLQAEVVQQQVKLIFSELKSRNINLSDPAPLL